MTDIIIHFKNLRHETIEISAENLSKLFNAVIDACGFECDSIVTKQFEALDFMEPVNKVEI